MYQIRFYAVRRNFRMDAFNAFFQESLHRFFTQNLLEFHQDILLRLHQVLFLRFLQQSSLRFFPRLFQKFFLIFNQEFLPRSTRFDVTVLIRLYKTVWFVCIRLAGQYNQCAAKVISSWNIIQLLSGFIQKLHPGFPLDPSKNCIRDSSRNSFWYFSRNFFWGSSRNPF